MYKSPAFETFLHGLIVSDHPQLQQAMLYSVAGGSKHIRPWLVFECGRLVGLEEQPLWPLAAAIELIHSYSLVHDDLPAMDNASHRRGKSSCWHAFDEATAILVGDALLPLAFSVLTKIDAEPACIVQLIQGLAHATGVHGMAAGQMFDITADGSLGPEILQKTQLLKTSMLIAFSCTAPALLAKKSPQVQDALRQFGEYLGLLYQLTDDILDAQEDQQKIPSKGQDKNQEAAPTWIKMVGVDGARIIADTWHHTAQQALSIIDGPAKPLVDFLNWVRQRDCPSN